MNRPTPEQIALARSRVQYWSHPSRIHLLGEQCSEQIVALIAATEPPTDNEIASVCAMASKSLGETRDIDDLTKAHAKALEKPRGNFYASFVRYAVYHFFGHAKP